MDFQSIIFLIKIHVNNLQFRYQKIFSMAINRSQNQTLSNSSLYLPKPYFIGSQIVHKFSKSEEQEETT